MWTVQGSTRWLEIGSSVSELLLGQYYLMYAMYFSSNAFRFTEINFLIGAKIYSSVRDHRLGAKHEFQVALCDFKYSLQCGKRYYVTNVQVF